MKEAILFGTLKYIDAKFINFMDFINFRLI